MLLDIIEKDLPQLIVGLDSLDDSANYIHIEDVKENIHYYCPCCKGLIKPRAYKKDIDYQVQAHFYHETGDCSEETYIHYICKNWLFEKGCKFIVKDVEYEVDYIEIEKTLHTSFGDYRPDIIVSTSIGKVFYFEIKTTNRKSALYAPKWDELGNDVVEVDTRYFVNQKHKNDVPEFRLIYSDGECFIKSYSRADYEDTIAKRKLEWKRQDKLNYKIQWERLDWFWHNLTNYKCYNNQEDHVVNSFQKLQFDDMDFVISIVRKMKCLVLYQKLIPFINKAFYEKIKAYKISPYEDIKFIQESPRIFYIAFQIYHIGNCYWYNSYFINKKIEYYGKDILEKFLECLSDKNFKKYTYDLCPCFNEIKEYKYKRVLTDENINFYLNERCAVHWNYYKKRFSKIFDNSMYIDIHSNLIGYRDIGSILRSSYPKRTLSKIEHLQRMQQYDDEYRKSLLTNFIIKKIDNCKNKYWRASLSKDNFYIHLDIGNIHEYYCININHFSTKLELIKNIKIRMNILIDRAKNSYINERVMEVL